MIKVFIVDDELLIVELIKNSVDWLALDMEIIGEAYDGEQALESISELLPDIIIMDINIPFINGVEVSRMVRERFPDTKIIMLTGYAEFKYVKEAINIGVISFLQKPIDSIDFTSALENSKKGILEKRNQRGYIKNEEYKVNTLEKLRFLNRMVYKADYEFFNTDTFLQKLRDYHIKLSPENLLVCIISIDHLKDKFHEEHKIKLRRFAVLNVTEEIMMNYYPAAVFEGADDQIVMIVNSLEHSNLRIKSNMQAIWTKIREFIFKHFNLTFTLSIGEIHQGYANIPMSFMEASAAMLRKFIVGNDQVIAHNELRTNDRSGDKILYDHNEALMDLRSANYGVVLQKVGQMYQKLNEDQAMKEFVILNSVGFVSVLTEYMIENNMKITNVIPNKQEFISYLNKRETLAEIQASILKLMADCMDYIGENKKSISSKIIEKAKRYIEERYFDKELTIEEISNHIYVNPSHLSRVFRKEMGCSLVEYLTNIRLSKAKNLLDHVENIVLSDAAEQTGYSDPYYFSKCFKKYYGVTPSKYLENKKQ